ncbi:vomeronasal type-1 receptor 1-like [Trichosurus vulpecula]|uniref:vomeronasal type-1 receptor 1-like n=1 Tax=Trichosurus vulpecula TaxID=9337 RepID=UPI00186ABDA3|nr:vomeronasal type-1 receptor 1-like [Trichosurus vulpecula]
MNTNEKIMSIIFFSQTGIGVLGNYFLTCLFIFIYLSGYSLRPIDTILTQLTLANCLVLLPKGVPQIMATLGLKNILDDTGCKIIFYLHRVSRGLSLTMTCLLTVFQAITITPSSSSSVELKARAPKYIFPSSLFSWTFHLLLNVFIALGIKGPRHTGNSTEIQDFGYCSYESAPRYQAIMFSIILSFPDAVCLGLTAFASGYMVFLLYRHHKQVQQIHISSTSARTSPEVRATQTILLLVSTFVSIYSLNSIFTAYMHFRKISLWLTQTSAFLTLTFPAVSPYLLISSDSQVPRYCYTLWERKRPHSTLAAD